MNRRLARLLGGDPVPVYRVAVRRRRPAGMFDGVDMAMSGRRWSWWCSCDGTPHHVPDQPTALTVGLTHLANHDRRPARR